jgi:DNA-binding protein H-NS
MELSTFEFADLLQLRTEVDAEIRRRESEEKAKAAKQVLELIRTHGLDIEDLATKSAKLGTATAAASRKPVEAKYRHPEDANLSWTGRGRKPLWVVAWLDAGGELEALQIK